MNAPVNGTTGSAHRWKFFRAGGVDQVALDPAADLAALPQLDQKLWVALSCPTRGLEFTQGPSTLSIRTTMVTSARPKSWPRSSGWWPC